MSSKFLEQKTICISAVPGALGHYLGALIYHAANPAAGKPNWTVDANVVAWPSQVVWKSFEPASMQYDLSALQARIASQTSTQSIDPAVTQVVVSHWLDSAAFHQLFPNSQVIRIAVEQKDIAQIGYNALYHECFRNGSYQNIARSVADALTFLNMVNEWSTIDEILEDGMHRDNLAVKLIGLNAGQTSWTIDQQQNNDGAYVTNYSKLYPYWKADRPAASQELINVLDFLQLDPVQLSPAESWQMLLPKFNQVPNL